MVTEHAKKHGTVYQIQCETQNKGKRVASSKRRIRWRFGFCNLQAVQEGKTGKDCRGAEHEVVFVWSLNSGKQLILADGHEVHWAKIGRKEKLEVAWDMSNGNHKLKVVAEPSVKSRRSSDSRQFDLLIDGISFTDLASIYELGTTNDITTTTATTANTSTTTRTPQRAMRQESRSYSMPDLLNISAPATMTHHQQHQQQQQQHTPPPKKTVQQHSPTSSLDLTVFDQGVEVQFHQQPQVTQQQKPHYQRSLSASYPQTPQKPQQLQQNQRSQSASCPQTVPPPQTHAYGWKDTTVPTPQQAYHSRSSWQGQAAYNYNWNDATTVVGSPQKRGSMGGNSYASSSNGYSTPTTSVAPYDDLDLNRNNDSPLSQALKSLGVDLLETTDDKSVTSNLSVASNPFDFVQPTLSSYTPMPQQQQQQQQQQQYLNRSAH